MSNKRSKEESDSDVLVGPESNILAGERNKLAKGLGTVVAQHYNKIEDKGLDVRNQSRIVYMRNFNNWIKSLIINRCSETIKSYKNVVDNKIVVVDLGSGKGGDLLKWKKARIHHLICVDIASNSIEQCRERYQQNSKREKIYSAEFIVADFTKVNLSDQLKIKNKVNIVSCQFSFHYCFESLCQAETTIKNVSELLCDGGLFVATCPDSNRIMSLLEESKSNSFGNSIYKIEFPKDRNTQNAPLFGDKYNFSLEACVNDCPEFLVHFSTLIEICKKYDLVLIERKSFDEMYEVGMQDREQKSLLFRMKALEAYPPRNSSYNLAGPEEEYSHAKEYMESKKLEFVKTLSKAEWEAICLYTAFTFKKRSKSKT